MPLLAIAGCVALMFSLDSTTLVRFLGWMVIGAVVYFACSRRRSALATSSP